MGAQVFTEFRQGLDAAAAFRAAVEQAGWDYGHAGYSGTIAEKGDFVLIPSGPLRMREAEALALKLVEEDDERITDKWGPAGALQVSDEMRRPCGWLFFGWASS